MQDISKKQEEPQNQEAANLPEQIKEKPAEFEVEKKVEVEKAPEIEKAKEIKEKEEVIPPPTVAPTAPAEAPAKSPTLEKIEDILEEDLEKVYFKMSPEKQAEFKQAGEETASKIENLLREAKVKIKKILDLIRNWLKIIPGINKFFLEQEAKIKTDKILDIKEENSFVSEKDKNKI